MASVRGASRPLTIRAWWHKGTSASEIASGARQEPVKPPARCAHPSRRSAVPRPSSRRCRAPGPGRPAPASGSAFRLGCHRPPRRPSRRHCAPIRRIWGDDDSHRRRILGRRSGPVAGHTPQHRPQPPYRIRKTGSPPSTATGRSQPRAAGYGTVRGQPDSTTRPTVTPNGRRFPRGPGNGRTSHAMPALGLRIPERATDSREL